MKKQFWVIFNHFATIIKSKLSISEESPASMSQVAQKLIELLLSVKLIELIELSIVISNMLENLLIESVSHWWNENNASCQATQNVGEFYHCVRIFILLVCLYLVEVIMRFFEIIIKMNFKDFRTWSLLSFPLKVMKRSP